MGALETYVVQSEIDCDKFRAHVYRSRVGAKPVGNCLGSIILVVEHGRGRTIAITALAVDTDVHRKHHVVPGA